MRYTEQNWSLCSVFKTIPTPFKHPAFFTADGQRKYLNAEERGRFIEAAQEQAQPLKLLCLVLVLSGCRLSEALNLKDDHISLGENAIVIRSLKQRGKLSYRQIPLPSAIITELHLRGGFTSRRIFPWRRTQALHHIKQVMQAADIHGSLATARALRHTFGVHAIMQGIPLHLVQRWLGHANISITAVYTQVLGPEERTIAKRMWTGQTAVDVV